MLASPAARVIINSLNLNKKDISGTGKHNMITKEDVINFQKPKEDNVETK